MAAAAPAPVCCGGSWDSGSACPRLPRGEGRTRPPPGPFPASLHAPGVYLVICPPPFEGEGNLPSTKRVGGGRGSRLSPLSEVAPKRAVSFLPSFTFLQDYQPEIAYGPLPPKGKNKKKRKKKSQDCNYKLGFILRQR